MEFSAIAIVLSGGLLNVADFGRYQIQKMQVVNAAQASAQMALKTCNDTTMLPATQKCSGLTTAITAAIQATSLGKAITLASGSPAEAYYCLDSTNALKKVSDVSSKPATCVSVGNGSATPADYIQISVTFPYTPLFKGLTVMGASGITAITATSWMRLG